METYDCIRPENQICFPLYACAKEVVWRYRKLLEELKLTYTQYIVMMVLWEFCGTRLQTGTGHKDFADT